MKWLNDLKITLLLVVLVLWPVKGLAENQRPVADAGLPRYAATNPVRLDGSASFDPDKSGPLTYTWRQIAGPSVTITDANTATPTIGGPSQTDARGRTIPGPFVQTDAIQECEFELVVSDGELTGAPDTVKLIIVPTFTGCTMTLENGAFDPQKPTVIFFAGGSMNGTGGGLLVAPLWLQKANVISFPHYEPDIPGPIPAAGNQPDRRYERPADMVIVYLSAVAPDYRQPIQTLAHSLGGLPALDVALRLNLTYADARYAVNHASLLDPSAWVLGVPEYYRRVAALLANPADGEQCWVDCHEAVNQSVCPSALNVVFDPDHYLPLYWYVNSLSGADHNAFNHGLVAGAYWSVVGPGRNLQLASTPGVQTYKFRWNGGASSGNMDFYNQSLYPGRLPEPVTLVAWADPSFADDDPNGVFLTCLESENAVGYQLLSGSDPHDVANYTVTSDSNAPPIVRLTALPLDRSWWTVRARDAYGSTIYADPMHVDSRSGPDTFLIRFVDFNLDKRVDLIDFCKLAQHWFEDEPSVDVAPLPEGDGIVDAHDLAFLAECWLMEIKDHHLVAHWRLDETEGNIAHDSANAKDGTLNGNPVWQPAGGRVNGALQLDGVDDYVSTPFILNPKNGPFSVFAWVKTTSPARVAISQTATVGFGRSWLCTDASGNLMTELKASGRGGFPLVSQALITDDQWHRVGFTWDGAYRTLYVDGTEVAKDSTPQQPLETANGGLYIGAANNLAAGMFWSGLIDDVRIYDRAVKP
jgi:hypothetical protein